MSQPNAFKTRFHLIQLRARLCQAWEMGDHALVEQLSAQIDEYQLKQWKNEIQEKESAI